jgi:hypothetical protein
MKTLKFLCLSLLLVASIGAQAQTAEEIVAKHVKALGGKDKLNAIKSLKMSGKMHVQGMDIPITMYLKTPNSMRTESTVQGMTMISAYDSKSKSGWYTNPMSGDKTPQKMNQEQTTEMEDIGDMIVGPLTNYKEKGGAVELIGKEDLEGIEVFKLMLTKKDKNVVYYFLDATSFLILKESSKTKFQDKEIESETFYSNYKTFNDITLATSTEQKSGGQLEEQTTMDKVEFDPVMEDVLFAMPPAENKEVKKDEKK